MHTHYVIEGLSEENPMIFLILSFFNNTSIRVHSLYSPITSHFSFSFIIYQLPRKTKKFLPPQCYGLETIVQVYCREQKSTHSRYAVCFSTEQKSTEQARFVNARTNTFLIHKYS